MSFAACSGNLQKGSEVEQSLLYCRDHQLMGKTGQAKHARPVIDQDLMAAWRLDLAKQYPALVSSKALLTQVGAHDDN
jgi:hypothetical protein